jgi:hypothetical protein
VDLCPARLWVGEILPVDEKDLQALQPSERVGYPVQDAVDETR